MMMATQFANPARGCARSLGLAALVVFGSLSVTSTAAKADTVFDVNATVGDIYGFTVAGPPTGLTLTGTLDINTVTGAFDSVALTISGDPNPFDYFLNSGSNACPNDCVFVNTEPFYEYGFLQLVPIASNPLVGYNGGTLLAGSWIYLDNPLGSDDSGVQYYLSGTVTATPEPRYYTALLGLVLMGSLVALRRRRQA